MMPGTIVPIRPCRYIGIANNALSDLGCSSAWTDFALRPEHASTSATLSLYVPGGEILAADLSAEGFCTGLRQLIEKVTTPSELQSLLKLNDEYLARLRVEAPNLKTSKGIHYADVLRKLAQNRMKDPELASYGGKEPPALPHLPLPPSKIAPGPRIDKADLSFGAERRFRDKAHLKFVASQPCLVCGRQPCHAHHLTFAQSRGLSMKVSDE